MKEVIWTFPYWIDHFPGMGSLVYKDSHLWKLLVLYFVIWGAVAKVLYIPKTLMVREIFCRNRFFRGV